MQELYKFSQRGCNSDSTSLTVAVQAQIGRPCILCKQKANGAGAFIPPESWKEISPGPNGLEKAPGCAFVYPICVTCRAAPSADEQIEKTLEELSRNPLVTHVTLRDQL